MKNLPLLTLLFLCAVLSRLLPHLPNVTAMMSISVVGAQLLQRKISIPFILVCLLVTDSLLAMIYGYPLLGSWMLFSYSGYALTTLMMSFFPDIRGGYRFGGMCGLSLFYWLWTNLGSFMVMYPHTLSGLGLCYINALPFLRDALIGNLIFLPIILCIVRLMRHQAHRRLCSLPLKTTS